MTKNSNKQNADLIKSLGIGDYVEVVTKENLKFKAIVVSNLTEGFVGRIISKDKAIGAASWERYGMFNNSRFQSCKECKEIRIINRAISSEASTASIALNESIKQDHKVIYYTTNLGNNLTSVFCCCEGYGGWSIKKGQVSTSMLEESFLRSQISRISPVVARV